MFTERRPKVTINRIADAGECPYHQALSTFLPLQIGASVTVHEYEVLKHDRRLSMHTDKVSHKAKIHGQECYQFTARYNNQNNKKDYEYITFEAKIDGHMKSLGIIEEGRDGTRHFYTFKDDYFMKHLALGENNSGLPELLTHKGLITEGDGQLYTSKDQPGSFDIVGRYKVSIDDKNFECTRLVLISNEDQVSDFFILDDGRELFHRFFTPDMGYDGKRNPTFSQEYPKAMTLQLNDRLLVCVSYIFPDYAIES